MTRQRRRSRLPLAGCSSGGVQRRQPCPAPLPHMKCGWATRPPSHSRAPRGATRQRAPPSRRFQMTSLKSRPLMTQQKRQSRLQKAGCSFGCAQRPQPCPAPLPHMKCGWATRPPSHSRAPRGATRQRAPPSRRFQMTSLKSRPLMTQQKRQSRLQKAGCSFGCAQRPPPCPARLPHMKRGWATRPPSHSRARRGATRQRAPLSRRFQMTSLPSSRLMAPQRRWSRPPAAETLPAGATRPQPWPPADPPPADLPPAAAAMKRGWATSLPTRGRT